MCISYENVKIEKKSENSAITWNFISHLRDEFQTN